MARWLKLLLHKAEDLSSIPGTHSGRREPIPGSCPLPSTPALWHACTPPPSHTWWGSLNPFGETLILALLYLLLKALPSHPDLQTHLTSEGGQIPGKSDGLINGNAEAGGASVIGAA